jgi:hypothetical protein
MFSVVCINQSFYFVQYRRHLLTVIFLFLIWGCQLKRLSKSKCASTHNGQFVHYTYDDGSGRLGQPKLSTFITRTDTIVTYTTIGISHKYKIEWVKPV